MKPVWKEVLCLGWQIDPRTKRRYEVKSQNITEAHHNFQKMRARGVPVPACWEHQDIEAGDAPAGADAVAEWKRNYARYTFAHLADSRINKRGNLDMLHEVEDDEDVKRLKKVKFVSPKIYNGYSDSRGGEYQGTTVVHSAATPTPVQNWQQPWELSEPDAMYLSYTPPDGQDECPSYSDTFSAWLSAVELSVTADPSEETTVADEETPPPKKKDDEGGGSGKGKKTLMDVIKALKDTGMNIPDEVEDECGLIIAIKASKGGEAQVEPESEPAPEPNPDADTTSAGGPPMVMSTLDRNPQRRKVAEREAKPERDDAAARVGKLFDTGRIDGTKKRALLRVAGGTEMSFTTDGVAGGKRWAAHIAELAELEKKPEWSVWKPKGQRRADGTYEMSATEPVKPPDYKGRPAVDEKRGQVGADFILGKVDYKDT